MEGLIAPKQVPKMDVPGRPDAGDEALFVGVHDTLLPLGFEASLVKTIHPGPQAGFSRRIRLGWINWSWIEALCGVKSGRSNLISAHSRDAHQVNKLVCVKFVNTLIGRHPGYVDPALAAKKPADTVKKLNLR
jgi:hypothetical protein